MEQNNQDKGRKQRRIKVLKFKEEFGFKTTEQRSNLMKKIRSSQTKPEIALRKALWAKGIRYRINVKTLKGSPDIVIKKSKLIVFIDGEFWHGYNWGKKKKTIKTNRKFWIPKIERNMQRDEENNLALKLQGYTVLRFWEHEIRKNESLCINKILQKIKKNNKTMQQFPSPNQLSLMSQ